MISGMDRRLLTVLLPLNIDDPSGNNMGGVAVDSATVMLRTGSLVSFVFISLILSQSWVEGTVLRSKRGDNCLKLDIMTSHGCQPCSLCNPDQPGFAKIRIRPSCKEKHPESIDHHGGQRLWCDNPRGPFPECPRIAPTVTRSCDDTCKDHGRTFAPGCVCTVGCHGDSPVAVLCSRDLQWNNTIPTNCTPPSSLSTITTATITTSAVMTSGTVVGIDLTYVFIALAVLALGIAFYCLRHKLYVCCKKSDLSPTSSSSECSDGKSDKSNRTDSPLLGPAVKADRSHGFLLPTDRPDREQPSLQCPADKCHLSLVNPSGSHSTLHSLVDKEDEGSSSHCLSSMDSGRTTDRENIGVTPGSETKVELAFPEVTLTSRPEQNDGALPNLALLGRDSGEQHSPEKMSVHLGPSFSSSGSACVLYGPSNGEQEERSDEKMSSHRALGALLNDRGALCEVTRMFDHKDRFDRVTWHIVAAEVAGWDPDRIHSLEYMIRPSTGGAPGDGPMYKVLKSVQQSGQGLLELLRHLESRRYRHEEAEAYLWRFWTKWKQTNSYGKSPSC